MKTSGVPHVLRQNNDRVNFIKKDFVLLLVRKLVKILDSRRSFAVVKRKSLVQCRSC
jgi:hypothetical protein